MKKTRSLLLSGIICILISGVPMFLYSIGTSPSKKGSSYNCTTVTYKTIPLNLSFASGFVNGCMVPESSFSDFHWFAGASALNDNSKYFCKITVTPDAPGICNASPSIFYWTTVGESKQINIPKNVASRLTVEYYERCAQDCATGAAQRRYFKYETTLGGAEPFVNAPLNFIKIAAC